MSSPLTNLTNAVNETIASEQSAISDIASLTPVTIAVVNESTVLTDAQVQTAMAALQIQVVRDFAPVWGCVARLVFFSKNSAVPPAYWQMAITDTTDVANALGYHDLTASGKPLGVVAAQTTIQDGENWIVTLSHETCLTGDTLIPLLDGRNVAIRDLEGKDHFWVYSCKENGDLRPGRAHSVRKTRENAELVKVTLDNGESVRCTPEHRFMTRDGGYKEAGLLGAGDSLMPLYRRQSVLDPQKPRKGMYEYEEVYVPAKDKWAFTHRMVVPFCSTGYVRHHKDFDRHNNSPENIEVLKWAEHQRIHAEHIAHYHALFAASGRSQNISARERAARGVRGRATLLAYNGSEKHKTDLERYWSDEEKRIAVGLRLQAYSSSDENKKRLEELKKRPDIVRASSERITAYNKSDKHREVARELGTKMFAEFWSDPKWRARHSERSRQTLKARFADPEYMEIHRERLRRTMHARWHTGRGIVSDKCSFCSSEQSAVVNHKVVSVESCGTEDVYDLTVDKYNNLALGAGVFVHNCEILRDPFINIACEVDNASGVPTTFYSAEVSDACEDDQFGYLINGQLMSDFVYPAWFMPGMVGPYDHMGHVTAPFQLLSGGYISVLDITTQNGWQQLNAQAAPGERVAPNNRSNRRLELRRKPRSQWVRSIR